MRCAYIVWLDSVHIDDWNAEADVPDARPEVSCGILIKETPGWVTIALSFAPETKQYGHLIAIPRVAIKEIQIFEKPAKQRAKRGKVQASEVGGVRLSEALTRQLNEAQESVRNMSDGLDHV